MSNSTSTDVFSALGFNCGGVVNLITLVVLSLFSAAWGYFKYRYMQEATTAKKSLQATEVPPELLQGILRAINTPQQPKHEPETIHI
jgi:hypothetical protein